MAELNPFKIAQKQLDTAAGTLGLDEATHQLLRWPQRELQVTIPVRMDDGTMQHLPRLPRTVQRRARADEGRPALAP